MRIVIVGGGIAAAYLANRIKKLDPGTEVMIVSEEAYLPYDRIHLCSLVDRSRRLEEIALPIDPRVQIELNQKIVSIDRKAKRIFSDHAAFSYDKLIIATGSLPRTLFDISTIKNAATFRNAEDCKKIAEGIDDKEVVMVGAGPIALELLETLISLPNIRHVTLLVRGNYLYDRTLSPQSKKVIESAYLQS